MWEDWEWLYCSVGVVEIACDRTGKWMTMGVAENRVVEEDNERRASEEWTVFE